MTTAPRLLALDFDGVVCDGMQEFVESAWRTLADVTASELPSGRRDELAARFAALRPIVESGWEMVVLLGLLTERPAADDAELREPRGFTAARDAYVQAHTFDRRELTVALDANREQWVAADPHGWLACHRFYPGVAAWLTHLVAEGRLVYVLSTKDKRFLDRLLAAEHVPLPSERIIGKAEPKREKWDVLRALAASHGVDIGHLWFVEDRLATLQGFRAHAPALADAQLFLAEWGYVFRDRDPAAARAAGIPVLTLDRMTGPFERWVR